MFSIGDTVLYGNDGVCRISEITEKSFGSSTSLYYILVPVFNNRSTVFVPKDNERLVSRMQAILPVDEIKGLIEACDEGIAWIDADSERAEYFKSLISGGEFPKILNMARCILKHRDEIMSNGKKLHKSDENILKDAVRIVYEELAMSVDVLKDDIADIICRKKSIA